MDQFNDDEKDGWMDVKMGMKTQWMAVKMDIMMGRQTGGMEMK